MSAQPILEVMWRVDKNGRNRDDNFEYHFSYSRLKRAPPNDTLTSIQKLSRSAVLTFQLSLASRANVPHIVTASALLEK